MLQKRQRLLRTRAHLATWRRSDVPTWWTTALVTAATAFFLVTVLIVVGSPLNDLDGFFYGLHLVPADSPWRTPVQMWVFLGQRVPAMIIAGLYASYRARRTRSSGPIVMYALAGVAFIGSVGTVKYLTGRIGPKYTDDVHTVWAGGTIFPSGHVTGAVVMYGLIALLAPEVHRRLMTAVAVVVSATVGMGTVALNTHWFSDVLGAWLDGSIVLLVVWAITPEAHRRTVRCWHRLRQRHQEGSPTALEPAMTTGEAEHPPATATPLAPVMPHETVATGTSPYSHPRAPYSPRAGRAPAAPDTSHRLPRPRTGLRG